MSGLRKYPCPGCGADIVVNVLAPGDNNRCRHCGSEHTVPETLVEVTSMKDLSLRQDGVDTESQQAVTYEESWKARVEPYTQLRAALLYLIFGLLACVFTVTLGVEPLVLDSAVIGDILLLIAFSRIRTFGLVTFWPSAGIGMCGISLIGRALSVLGLNDYVGIDVEALLTLIALLILFALTDRISRTTRFRLEIVVAMVASVGSFAFLIGAALGVSAASLVHKYLMELPAGPWLAWVIGGLLPVIVLQLVAVGFTVHAAFGIRKAIRTPADVKWQV